MIIFEPRDDEQVNANQHNQGITIEMIGLYFEHRRILKTTRYFIYHKISLLEVVEHVTVLI